MADLKSGNINVGNNTPTGAPMQIAVDNPYITKDDYIASFEASGLNITASSPQYANGQLDKMILRASAWVNRYCGRWFDQQTIDEQKTGFQVRPYNPQLVTVVLKNRPYARINSIYIQVLQWFIQIDTSPSGYLQDFYDKGFYKIVPLLSSAGTGIGSPIPAAILDRVPLGVLWTNYTFGFGTPLTAQVLSQVTANTVYQAPIGNRLFAPTQTLNVYKDGVLQSPALYTVDYPNGKITFLADIGGGHVVTADFTTNQSIPADIQEAVILLTSYLIGQAQSNPLGAVSYGIQTFNINFGSGGKGGTAGSAVKARVEELLEPYVDKMPTILGF